jgi:hypothetical protein
VAAAGAAADDKLAPYAVACHELHKTLLSSSNGRGLFVSKLKASKPPVDVMTHVGPHTIDLYDVFLRVLAAGGFHAVRGLVFCLAHYRYSQRRRADVARVLPAQLPTTTLWADLGAALGAKDMASSAVGKTLRSQYRDKLLQMEEKLVTRMVKKAS